MPPKKSNQEDEVVSLSVLHELLDQQKSFYKDLLEQQEKSFKSFVQMIMDSTNKRLDSLSSDVGRLTQSVEFSQAELEDLKIGYKTSLDCHKTVSKDLDNMQSSFSDLSVKCDYLENQTRRNNLIFDGIPDSKTESWHESEIKVKKLITEHLKMDPSHIELERAHRTGKFDAEGRPRSVMVKLLRFKDKEEILKRAKYLKGSKLYINEDFSEKVRLRRKELLPQLREARNQGNVAYLKYDQLVVHPPRTAPGTS